MSDENKGDPGVCKTEAVVVATKRYFFERSGAVPRMCQLTGRRYPKLEAALADLSVEALQEFVRFVSDAQQEVQRVKNQAIHQPWRR